MGDPGAPLLRAVVRAPAGPDADSRADAALRAALERSQPSRPVGGSDRLLDFACHTPGMRTKQCPDLAEAYARMLRCFGRRLFDVYARRSVSPSLGETSTLAQVHFWAWCRSVGVEDVLDDDLRARMKEARLKHRHRKRPVLSPVGMQKAGGEEEGEPGKRVRPSA